MRSKMTELSVASLPSSDERIEPWRGEFADAANEAAFRADTLSRVVQQQRNGLLVWAALMLVFAIPEFISLGAGPTLWVLTTYRVLLTLLLLAVRTALGRRPALGLHGRWMLYVALLSYPFFFLLYFLRPEIRAFNTGMVMVIQLTLFLFLPVRVALSVWVALFGAVGATLSVWMSSADLVVKVGTAFLVTMPGIVGYTAALRLQKTERHEYWLRRQLQEANRELQGEVTRRISLEKELAQQAATDPLTGLANRRAFAERFALESARAQRSGTALTLALFDLDHFKRINDSDGHAAGDAVLRCVGELCSAHFRGVDFVARVGGEEFAVLLPTADLEQAAGAVKRFAAKLTSACVAYGATSLRVSATAGVAQWNAQESLDMLTARADSAMYAGKRAGRDRVVLAQAAGPAEASLASV